MDCTIVPPPEEHSSHRFHHITRTYSTGNNRCGKPHHHNHHSRDPLLRPSRNIFKPTTPIDILILLQLISLAYYTLINPYLPFHFRTPSYLDYRNYHFHYTASFAVEKMSTGFPKLVPAFTALVPIDPPSPVGSLSRGPSLLHVRIREGEGSLTSEPTYPITLSAVFTHGSDYIRADPDGRHVRLQVDSVLKTQDEAPTFVKFSYMGTIDATGGAGKVLRGEEGAETTEFGEVFTHVSFETGSEALREMEHKVYVASGRFILEAGKPPIVEYKISEVAN